MLETLEAIELFLPTFVAIATLTMFTPKTRWMCYTAIVLCIFAEMIPLTVNTTALFACTSALFALFLLEFLYAAKYVKRGHSARTGIYTKTGSELS